MNLIEQLGGHEKAKRELQLKIDNSVLQCCMSVTADMIQDALLEYRRENNIFEVGDTIVFIKGFDNLLMTYTEYQNTSAEGICRHATEKEIEQGFRDE